MKHKQITEVSIDDEDLDVEFYRRIVIKPVNVIEWDAGAIFTKTLTANTTLSFSNLTHAQNKVVTLLITGDYALALPDGVRIISGEYKGSMMNYIQIHCVNNTMHREEYWATFSQATLTDQGV